MPMSFIQRLRSVQGVFGVPFLESQGYLVGVAVAVSAILMLSTGHVDLTTVLIYTLICGNVAALGNALAVPFYGRRSSTSWMVFLAVQLPLAVVAAFLASFTGHLATGQLRSFSRGWRGEVPFTAVMTFLLDLITFYFVRTRNRMKEVNDELAHQVELGQQQLQSHASELRAAFDIQSSLLPRTIPQIAGVEISCAWQPARTVSGDFFDVVVLSETKIAVCLADVSGKGLSAALVTANLQAAFRAFLTAEPHPGALCTRLNEALCANLPPGRFVTLVYGVIDTGTRTFTYELAGHGSPLLLRSRDVLRLEGSGPVLGLLPFARFSDQTVALHSGDCLLLTTDGVTEAFDHNEEEFGEDRVIKAARSALSGSSAGAHPVRSAVMSAVTAHAVHGFHDDASVMVVRVL